MDKKKIILAVSALVVLSALLILVFSTKKKPPATDTSETSAISTSASSSSVSKENVFPSGPGGKYSIAQSSDQHKSIITTPKGERIEINNPNSIAEKKLDDKDIILKTANDYQILYYNYNEGPSFLVSILSFDIENARRLGEETLLSTLGISKEQACKLSVSLTVPKNVSEKASGYNYGLSFCSNGKHFPK